MLRNTEIFPSLPTGLIFSFTLREAKHADPESRARHWPEKELERNPKKLLLATISRASPSCVPFPWCHSNTCLIQASVPFIRLLKDTRRLFMIPRVFSVYYFSKELHVPTSSCKRRRLVLWGLLTIELFTSHLRVRICWGERVLRTTNSYLILLRRTQPQADSS